MSFWGRKQRMAVGIVCLLVLLPPMQTVQAVTIYESDGVSYEEGYIFIGESHAILMSQAIGQCTDEEGNVSGLSGVRMIYREDGSLAVAEDGKTDTMYMKGNLFFVYEGWMGNEGAIQTDKTYIYSDGQGKRGRGVERIHEIMESNPNIEHWNIVCYQGALAVIRNDAEAGSYYVSSYKNWIEHEFPYSDIYFLSQSTMTKYYRSYSEENIVNDALAMAFPYQYLDYMDFFNERYPQGMLDPMQRSDGLHWSSQTYVELVTDVIREIQHRRGLDHAVAKMDGTFYTNADTVIYAVPDWNGTVVLSGVDAGLPVHVTGVTDNGFFRVDLGVITAYIHGMGLNNG